MTNNRPSGGGPDDAGPPPGPNDYILQLEDVSRSFGAIRAVDSVSLGVRAGEVVALLGENGAGKSTLTRLIAGEDRRDAGVIRLAGHDVDFSSPAEGLAAGIATVHQHPRVAGELSVAANLVLGREAEVAGAKLRLRPQTLRKGASMLLPPGFDLPLDMPAKELSVAGRQLLAIARAVARQPKLLMLDEPTAALNSSEVDLLFTAIRGIRATGTPIIFVTHRLNEVPMICDRAIVMRDGRIAGELDGPSATAEQIVSLMVGRAMGDLYPPSRNAAGEVLLEVEGLATPSIGHIDLTLRAGEIIGVTGAMGAGQAELAEALIGYPPMRKGQVLLDGRPLRLSSPRDAIAAGLAYVSGDRERDGLLSQQSIEAHLTILSLSALQRARFLLTNRLRNLANGLVARFGIKAASTRLRMDTLSGGNQQKVLLARWFANPPRVLILNEPTLGIDVGSRAEVYTLMAEAAERGMGVLLVTSDVTELLGLSDRIAVIRDGHVVGWLEREQATEDEILKMAHGVSTTAGGAGA